MADKKISQLPQINALSGSSIIVPLVHDSTTQKMELGAFASYVSQWSAKTGSANTFSGTQTFSGNVNVAGNVNVNGRLTVHEVVANYETASIIFSSGSNKFGDQPSDKHEFTGSTSITGSLYYNDVLVTNIDSNTVFKLQQATQSLNTQTGSQASINSGISAITGAFATELGGIQTTISGHRIEVNGIEAYTASLKGQAIVSSSQQILNYNIFATTGSNTFRANQVITGSLSISAGEFNVTTGSGNMTSSLIFDHTQNDGVTLGLRHNDRLSLADHTFNVQVWAGGVYTQFVRNGTPYSILNVEAFDDNKIYLYRDTRLYNKSLVIDNNLTVQRDVVIGSGSLSIQRGQFNAVTGSGALTSSLSFTHTEVDPITGNGTLELRYRNNDVGPENNAWKFVATDNGVQVRYDQYTTSNKMLFSVSSFGSNFDKLLIWRDVRLFGTGLTVDDSLLVKGVITGSILATNGVVSSSNQLFELNQQTGSQNSVNLGISSVTGSLIGITNGLMAFTAALDSTYATDAQLYQLYQATASIHSATASFTAEIGGIEAYTASLKAAAIVSSSTQIQNYNLFALDANVAVKASGSTLYSTNPSTTNFSQVNSVFLGGGAGQDATGADSSIFLGYNAGIQATAAQESFFAGNTAGGYSTNALRSNFIGISAGAAATNASHANFIGYGVGQSATNASYANFIGSNAGFIATNATYANFIGGSAGQNATNASYSNFIGNFAGDGAANASYSNLSGFSAGKKVFGNGIGANNIIIGTNITLENDRRDSINFGGIIFATGSYRTTSGNPYSGSVGHGKVGINKILPSFELDISGSVGITGSLKVSEGITGSLYSTNGVISSSNQLFELNTQTGSQDLVNLGISTFTGSLRSEVNLIEAYTASLKAAAIVSSSTQITNYYKFAETASANTFYGNQTINGNLQLSSTSPLVYNAGNTNAMLFGFFDGGTIYGPYYQIFGSNYSNASQRGSAEFVFDSRNSGFTGFNIAEFNGSTWLRKFRVSPSGAEVTGSFVVDGGITGSLMATNNVVSSSTQIQNYNLFAVTSSANSFYGAQSVSGSLFVTSNSGFGTSDATGSGILKVISAGTQNAFSIGQSNSKRWTGFGANDLKVYGDDYFITTVDAFPLSIGTNGISRITIANDGGINATGAITASNFRISTAGGGIDFGVTSNGSGTTTSELLNDYEEGTWTPVIRGSGTAGTYELQTDYTTYTKIGRQVTVSGNIRLGTSVTGGGTGYLQITGLPFQKAANTAAIGAVLVNGVDYTGTYLIVAFTSISASSILYLSEIRDNDTPIDLPISAVSANDEIAFTITYFN